MTKLYVLTRNTIGKPSYFVGASGRKTTFTPHRSVAKKLDLAGATAWIDCLRTVHNIDVIPVDPESKTDGGYLLLELMIVCIVLLTLMTMSVEPIMQINRARNQSAARSRVLQVGAVNVQLDMCTASATCPTNTVLRLQLVASPPATQTQQGYTYVFVPAGPLWTFTAAPNTDFDGRITYSIGAANVLTCSTQGTVQPCP